MVARSGEEQQIGFPLVVAFIVVMFQELGDGAPQGGLAEYDQFGQALAFDGPHPALRKGIQIRAACRQQEWLDSAGAERCSKRSAEFAVAIMQRKPNMLQSAVDLIYSIARHLYHPLLGR